MSDSRSIQPGQGVLRVTVTQTAPISQCDGAGAGSVRAALPNSRQRDHWLPQVLLNPCACTAGGWGGSMGLGGVGAPACECLRGRRLSALRYLGDARSGSGFTRKRHMDTFGFSHPTQKRSTEQGKPHAEMPSLPACQCRARCIPRLRQVTTACSTHDSYFIDATHGATDANS